MLQIHLEEESVLKVILRYLEERGYAKSMRCLEKETGVLTEDETDEDLSYLRELVLDGRFQDAIAFLEPMLLEHQDIQQKIMFQLKRQQFLERLHGNSSVEVGSSLSSAVIGIVQELQGLRELCDKEEFNSLWYTLTLERIQDHPDMKGWTPERGRLECFRLVRTQMEIGLELSRAEDERKRMIPRGQLLHLLAQASTLKMEPLWRGEKMDEFELPEEFMADLIFRVRV